MPAQYYLNFNKKGSGFIVNETAGENLGNHKVVYRGVDSLWYLADADLATTMPVIGITMGAISANRKGEILLQGYIGDNSWTWTAGDDLYASTVAGELTNVAPTAPDIVQIVANVVEPTLIYFSSDLGSGGGGSGDCAILEGHTAYVGFNSCKSSHTNYFYCDGTADDVQINAALTYVDGLGGGSVFLERGVYDITDPITFPGDNLMLCGTGRDSFLDGDNLATGEHCIVISGDSKDYCVIKDLAIQTQDGGTKTCHCIYIEDGADRFKIDSVVIVDSDSDGIHIEGGNISLGSIINCIILDTDDNGIETNMDAGNFLTGGLIKNNLIISAGLNAISATEVRDTQIIGNIIWNNGYNGLYFADSETCIIEANHIYANIRYGVHIDDTCVDFIISNNIIEDNDYSNSGTYDGIYTTPLCTDIQIIGNRIDGNDRNGLYIVSDVTEIKNNRITGNGYYGIRVGSDYVNIYNNTLINNGLKTPATYHGIYFQGTADQGIIIGNYIEGDGTNQEDCIHLADGATEAFIEDNYCYNGAGSGIVLTANSDDCVIQGNHLIDNDDYGIEIAAATCNNNRVFDNKFNGNGTGAISDSGTDTATPEFFAPVTDPDGTLGTHPALILTDALEVSAYNQFAAPLGYQELVSASVIMVAGGAGNLYRSVATNWGKICSTEDYDAGTDSIASGAVAVLADDMTCIDISTALDQVTAGDLVGIQFTREGDDVLDTIGADCYYLGVRVRYV